MQAFVSKTRRPKFELSLKVGLNRVDPSLKTLSEGSQIKDLNNVPLVSGTSYVKWHLPSSTSAEHRGTTPKAVIREHKATWEYTKTLPVRLTVDRTGVLSECEIHFEILQEYSPGARAERIVLGNVKLNLAEFVDGSESGEEAVTRRYLMQESKINSTLKVCLYMRQTEGDRNFIAPTLKTAPVFGGIAGIMTTEQGDANDGINMPSMSSMAQESGKLQDLYRRNLAASFAAQSGELPADKCVEDIFNGGDGWGDLRDMPASYGSDDDGDDDRKTVRGHQRHSSGTTVKSPNSPKKGSGLGAVSGRASIEQQVQSNPEAGKSMARGTNYVDELTAREDLKSWQISSYG